MAISYVGGVVAQRAGATSTTTQSINGTLTGGSNTAPSVGDLIVATLVVGSAGRNPAQAITTPSGFTTLGTQLLGNGSTYDLSLIHI